MAKSPQPTAAELQILGVLWRSGPSTVRQVHETLHGEHGSSQGYTTVLKLMQIMLQKGWLERDESSRTHVYRPASAPSATQRGILGDLVDRAFAGSVSDLVLSALAAKPASPDELAEIRRFLDEQEAGVKKKKKR
jgi:predicted transcriptional regulator